MLHVRMLGEFTVELDGSPVNPPESRRAWALLAWLALHPGTHPRGPLAARFWPDTLDSSARANLRSAIWSLRRALGPSGRHHLTAKRELVGFEPDVLDTDVAEFGRLVEAGRLAEAVNCCSGDLLPGLDDEWVFPERDEHRDRVSAALGRLSAEAETRGELDIAVRLTRQQVELAPLSEDVHRDLVRRLAAAGDRAGALIAYERLRDRFRDELGIAPSSTTRRLAASLRAEPAPEHPWRRVGATDGQATDRRLPQLIGRDEPLARMMDCWRAAANGQGGVIHLAGEAGIGKTRLALELAARAGAQGGCVATCAGLDLAGAAPFGLWAELLRDIYRELEAPPLSDSWADLLSRLVPDLAGMAGPISIPVPASPELERTRLFEGIVQLVEWASRQRPLLLILDDVHLADAPSLELVRYLGRRIGESPPLIVLTRRDLPPRAEVDALVHALRSRGVLAADVQLGPMPDREVRELLRAVPTLKDVDVARIVHAAEGNPLLASESARAIASGQSDLAAGLHGTVRASFRSLEPSAQLLAEFAAVAGRNLDREEIDALPVDQWHAAATSAVESGLLVADGGYVGYRHALLREAVYQGLPAPRRAWLHETFAAALQSCEARVSRRRAAEVARHLRLAGEDERAVEYLAAAAADARAVSALAEAADFLTEAASLAPHNGDLLLELGEVEAWRGRRDAADRAFNAALSVTGRDDLEATAAAWLRRGRWLRGALCIPGAARDSYRTGLSILDGAALPAPDSRIEAIAGLAWAEAVAGDTALVDGLVGRLEELSESTSRTDLLVHDIGAARSFSLIRRGRFEESYEPAIMAAEAAERAGRPDMAYGCWANAASAAACAGDFERSLEFTEHGLQTVHNILPSGEVHLLAARAHILARLGRADEAHATTDAELSLAERLDQPELRATALHDCGMVGFAIGDYESAQRLLAEALEYQAPISRPRARLARAEALVHLHRLDDAERELRATTLEPVTPSDFPHTLVLRLTRIQGLLAAARGDLQLAEQRLREASEGWSRFVRAGLAGEDYVANLADLGRPPVEGLIEPARELSQVRAELDSLRAGAKP